MSGNGKICPHCYQEVNAEETEKVKAVNGFWLFGEPVSKNHTVLLSPRLRDKLWADGVVVPVNGEE